MAESYKNSSGPFVQGIVVPNQFLRNWLPVEYQLKNKIAQRLLPPHIYRSYARWQHEQLSERLIKHISKSLSCSLNLCWREVENNAPKYYDCEASLQIGDALDSFETISYGQSFESAGEAESRCLGEFLERFFLKDIDVTRTVVATKQKLGRKAIDINNMPLYLPWQVEGKESFISQKGLFESPISWVKGKSILNRNTKFIPANRVFWGQYDKRSKSLNQPTSNGNGGGFSHETAVLSGLYELVERDSFMCHWLMKLPGTVIEMDDTVGERLQDKLKMARRYSMEVIFLDITMTIQIPTVLCVIFDRHDAEDVKITVGAATGYDTDRILEKSYLEALAVMRRHWLPDKPRSHEPANGARGLFANKDFDAKDWEIRLDRYRGAEAEKQLNFLRQGKKVSYYDFSERHAKKFSSRKQEFRHVRQLFNQLARTMPGMHPYVYTARDKNHLLNSVGFHVVSVVVPQLFPLYLTEHQATLDISALTHWRQAVAASGATWTGEIKNVFPHPFP